MALGNLVVSNATPMYGYYPMYQPTPESNYNYYVSDDNDNENDLHVPDEESTEVNYEKPPEHEPCESSPEDVDLENIEDSEDLEKENNTCDDEHYLLPDELNSILGLFSGGDGSRLNPFRIATQQDLFYMGGYTSGSREHEIVSTFDFNRAYYVQTSDIDMQKQFGFRPIGFSQTNGFTGSFNGAGFEIRNLMIDFDRQFLPFTTDNIQAVGLFGFANNANLDNIRINGLTIDVLGQIRNNIGGLVGYAINTTINNVEITGSARINAPVANHVGGLVGTATGTNISNITINVNVLGQDNVGGVVGNIINNTPISHSSVRGNIEGRNNVGGIFGSYNSNDTISVRLHSNYSHANVSGNDNVGGIGGHSVNTLITTTAIRFISNSYTKGYITGNENVGGILGASTGNMSATANASINNASANLHVVDNYTIAELMGNNMVGGIVGRGGTHTNISRNYVNNTIRSNGVVGGIAAAITARSTNNLNHTAVRNNLVIAEIIAPSTAPSGILFAQRTNVPLGSILNNYYSFSSSISGGAARNFEHAQIVFDMELTTPGWWENVLMINETNSFDISQVLRGNLPTVLQFGSNQEVPSQERMDFSGNNQPYVIGNTTHILGATTPTIMFLNTFGTVVIRVEGLRQFIDYIPGCI